MGERFAQLVLLAGFGWCLAAWAGTVRAESDEPSPPGVFPPLSRPDDEPGEDPADFLAFLRGLGEPSAAPRPKRNPIFPSLSPQVADLGPPSPTELPANVGPLPGGQPGQHTPQKVSSSRQGWWGALTSNVVVNDDPVVLAGEQPFWQRNWKADQSWRLDVAGPVSAFGQIGSTSTEVSQADMQVNARTGLACRVPVPGLAQLILRSALGVSYTDPLRPERTVAQSDWLFEVQARCPLLFGAGLEYQASALPALTPQMQDQLNQDLRVAFPVGASGKVRVGARHKWANTPTPSPWSEGMQLYLGLELAR